MTDEDRALVEELIRQGKFTLSNLMRASGERVLQRAAELLAVADGVLMERREPGRYGDLGFRGRKLATLEGTLRFDRRRYLDRKSGRSVCLLDELIGLKKWQRVSEELAERAVMAAVKGPSYREARDQLDGQAGRPVLSHETLRQLVLKRGARVRSGEADAARRSEGNRRVEALFVAADGMYVSLQGGGGERREIKVAVAFEGWRGRQGGFRPTDYALEHSRYFSGLEEGEEFWEEVRGGLAAVYADLDRTLMLINGDEAAWIGEGREHFGRALYQRDRYHAVREVREALGHLGELRKAALTALAADDVGSLREHVLEGWRRTPPGPARERLARLAAGLARSGREVVDYRTQLEALGVQVRPGWRGLGVAESTIKRYKHRIGKRGRSWSVAGLEALLALLDKLYGGTLVDKLRGLSAELAGEPWEPKGLFPRQVPPAVGRGSLGARQGHMPALDGALKGFAPLFRDLGRPQGI